MLIEDCIAALGMLVILIAAFGLPRTTTMHHLHEDEDV